MSDIDKIMKEDSLNNLANFVADPENKVTDLIICYQTEQRMGYKYLESSSMAALKGLLEIALERINQEIVYLFDDEDDLD